MSVVLQSRVPQYETAAVLQKKHMYELFKED